MVKIDWLRRRGSGAAGVLMPLMLLLAACGARNGGPAPLVSGDQPPPPTQIIVQSGQTLSGIAHASQVPMQALADANHLTPPYRIRVGQALIVPGGGAPGAGGPMVAAAEAGSPPPFSPPPYGSSPYAPAPYSLPPVAAPNASPNPPPASAQAIPLDAPRPVSSAKPPPGAPPTSAAASLAPPVSPDRSPSAVSSPAVAATAVPPSDERSPPPAGQPAGAPDATADALSSPAPHGNGAFQWPVRGRVVEGYGVGPDGTHNDGINIAAPRGAAVEAADGGVVAYSGNELRGYGNLILIKHPNGWISAYAHCDLILVKTGQKVTRGQVIARVGATGNVSEPQLHFELRRGKKPVDPREYLGSPSTAAVQEPHPG